MTIGETTEVEAHFDVSGKIVPRRFTWHGSTLVIEGVGRRWREEGVRCFAVLAAGGRPFELRLDEETLRWRVSRHSVPGSVV
ncbi:MAG: hypothetical protein SXV54_11295 [Chloroflexota bacterium]|nr:hypothetical protein [Chloroflexota bacterium]